MRLVVRPLTAEVWPALEDLFGEKGACGGCWCMYWRIGAAYRKRDGTENKAAFREVVEEGPPPGLLAFEGEKAVGWCQVTPRENVPWLEETWRLKRVDETPVWALTCFYVRKGYRRKGVTAVLIGGAVKAARVGGAQVLEAYPLDGGKSPSATGTGYLSTFLKMGFKEVARRSPERAIVRLALK